MHRLLVVDVDRAVLHSASTWLRSALLTVDVAWDAAQGLELARLFPPDVVLLDACAMDLLEPLRRLDAGRPMILMSAEETPPPPYHLFAVVRKPLEASSLREVILGALQGIEQRQLHPGVVPAARMSPRSLQYRPGTTDEQVIKQVFTGQHYNLSRLQRFPEIAAFLEQMAQGGRYPLIIDGGANIGASSVYLSLAFPGGRVVAVEPEAGNFALLSQNVLGLDVQCVQAALASQPGSLHLSDPGLGPWAYRTERGGGGPAVPAVTVPQLFQEHGGASFFPFLVKVDIEGSEKDLFAANAAWVQQLPIVIVELHDWLLPRQGTALPFLRCVAGLERDFLYLGENVFSIAHRLDPDGLGTR